MILVLLTRASLAPVLQLVTDSNVPANLDMQVFIISGYLV